MALYKCKISGGGGVTVPSTAADYVQFDSFTTGASQVVYNTTQRPKIGIFIISRPVGSNHYPGYNQYDIINFVNENLKEMYNYSYSDIDFNNRVSYDGNKVIIKTSTGQQIMTITGMFWY